MKIQDEKIADNNLDSITTIEEARELFGRVARDPVTNAFTKHFFIGRINSIREEEPDEEYDLLCLEIESYELLRGRYSDEVCDGFVGSMVDGLTSFFLANAVVGRMDDAHIVFYMPHMSFDTHEKMMDACAVISGQSPYPIFDIRAGVCAMERDMGVEEAYGNCLLAIEGIRFSPDCFIAEYDDTLRHEKQLKEKLEQDMRKALAEEQFIVLYQPKSSFDGTDILGAEALVRWNHPELGLLAPNIFIPLFEKNGFIFELDKYVVNRVCKDLCAWKSQGLRPTPVSVNISQTDFDQVSLPSILEEIVDAHGISHDLLHFEITESSEAPDAMKKINAVDGLRKRGFLVELDDFGAGYSTFGILRSMPVDVIKTDISLVNHLEEPENLAILEGTLLMVDKLGLELVIEGVETQDQLNMLGSLLKDRQNIKIQGFVFFKPLPVSELTDLLQRA